MTLEISLKKYRIHNLQKEYYELSENINNTQIHILRLFNDLMIDNSSKNNILSRVFEISRNLNESYNTFIIEECNSDDEIEDNLESTDIDSTCLIENKTITVTKDIIDYGIFSFICQDKNTNNDNIYDKLRQFSLRTHILNLNFNLKPDSFDSIILDNNSLSPLKNIKMELLNICKDVGTNSLKELLEVLIGNFYRELYDEEILKKIDFYNKIFILTGFKEKEDLTNDDIFNISKSDVKMENDYLEKIVNINLKSINSNKVFVFIGYFINDSINVLIKTSQIANKDLYIKKKQIIEKLNQNININRKFKKNYMRNILLKELLAYNPDECSELVEELYNKYIDLSKKSFMNIMKDFIGKNNTIKNMYDIIRLLLLGTEENENVAGLLFGLTKEKKVGSYIISELIYSNLNYSCQLKIKRSNINLKEEFEKIKSLSIEDVDMKKQILAMKKMPSGVKSLALEKVEEMKSSNNEYYKQMTYVKCLIKYPWACPEDNQYYNDLKDDQIRASNYIKEIETKLNSLSYGHTEAKKSLLQLVGKWISNPNSSGSSIALVGPPGVGKTLLAKSVSSALNIPFAQITLGGQNDGELLHGHGYTYSGSQPGMIIRKMIETGQSRCIIYFDELDKACSKHGTTNEIMSILIHLTDPNMNKSFQDRFFQGIDFPLDKVIMIFSYNDSSLIDPILLDRFKEIEVKPYNINDKMKIVNKYIIPELLENIGFNKNELSIKNECIENVIEKYTHEAGVRGIKRIIENIFLKLNLDKICARGIFKNKKKKIEINSKIVEKTLNQPMNESLSIHKNPEIGIINGLYATSIGTGGLVPIQIFANYSGSSTDFEFKLTGKLGNVMKESIQCSFTAAIDFIKRNKEKYNFIENIDEHLKKNFPCGFHVHAPSTSTPKDGPSAGGAFSAAFVSRILHKKIRNDVALTGEIDLRGRITKIGGLNYKLIGARKANIIKVLVPKENKDDIEEIGKNNPDLVNKFLKVVFVEKIDEIIEHILLD
jgi:endopeptidase La